jgi:hypothetical protein
MKSLADARRRAQVVAGKRVVHVGYPRSVRTYCGRLKEGVLTASRVPMTSRLCRSCKRRLDFERSW